MRRLILVGILVCSCLLVSCGSAPNEVTSNRIVPELEVQPTQTPWVIVVTATSVPSPQPTAAPPDGVVLAQILNVRYGPGTGYERITKLHTGDEVEITGKGHDATWLQIALPDSWAGWVVNNPDYLAVHISVADLPLIPLPYLDATSTATLTLEPSTLTT